MLKVLPGVYVASRTVLSDHIDLLAIGGHAHSQLGAVFPHHLSKMTWPGDTVKDRDSIVLRGLLKHHLLYVKSETLVKNLFYVSVKPYQAFPDFPLNHLMVAIFINSLEQQNCFDISLSSIEVTGAACESGTTPLVILDFTVPAFHSFFSCSMTKKIDENMKYDDLIRCQKKS